MVKRHSSQTQKGTPYGVGVHVEDRHSGGGRELSGKGDVRLQRPARGYLSSLVPGVATVSTSPHYTATLCWMLDTHLILAVTSEHHLQSTDITISVQVPVRSFGVPFRSLKSTLKSKEKWHARPNL